MHRTSDFVRPDDVVDPDSDSVRPDEVDFDGAGDRVRRSVVTLVCIVGVVALAAWQPHARNFVVPSQAPIAAMHH